MPETAKQTIARVRKEIGVTETPPGSNTNKFTQRYGMNGAPWCAMFTWCMLTDAGVPIIRSAYTPTIADWFKTSGRGFVDDKAVLLGDIVFFDFPDSVARIQHIGFVTGVNKDAGVLYTIEGNTSSGVSGSQDDGGGVYERTRPFSQAVYFGRPQYKDAEPKLPQFAHPKAKTWIGKGDSGADVKTWQRDLNRWVANLKNPGFLFKIEVDGEFGNGTLRATKTFQAFYKLDVDGRVGTHTVARMERVRARQKLKGGKS